MAPAFDFKIVLDQYNRQLGYFRETAQKVIAGLLAYAGVHAGSRTLALTEETYAKLFLFAHATLFVYVVVVGTTNYLRMARSHSAVIEALAPDAPADLRKLGILLREPALVAAAWGSLYLLVHGGFLVIVHLVSWPK